MFNKLTYGENALVLKTKDEEQQQPIPATH